MADRRQTFGFTTRSQLLATERVAKCRPGKARIQELQAVAAVPIECGRGHAEQAQITLAPPACVRPRLTRAAGRAPHVVPRLDGHRAQSEIREGLNPFIDDI
jgi:hypothetical protein